MPTVSEPRKRIVRNKDGSESVSWQFSYRDRSGKRHFASRRSKSEARDAAAEILEQLRHGTHTPDSKSQTVYQAGKAWIMYRRLLRRRRATLTKYEQHLELHINDPEIGVGGLKLSRLATSDCQEFMERLLASRSHAMTVKVMSSLRMLLGYARRKGLVHQNVATPVRVERTGSEEIKDVEDRDARFIPKTDLLALLKAITPEPVGGVEPAPTLAQVYVNVRLFSGLREGELRALRKPNIRLDGPNPTIRVIEAADQWNEIGPPKTKNSIRTVPIGPELVKLLRRWLLVRPKSKRDLVLPNGAGNVESQTNINRRVWQPACIAAGLADPALDAGGEPILDEDGQPVLKPRYRPNALRHMAASLWIAAGAAPKTIQSRMGHASIQTTFDLYGHLWEDQAEAQTAAAAVERMLLSQ